MSRVLGICVRLCVYSFTALSCLSFGVSSFCSTPPGVPPAWNQRQEVLSAQLWSGRRHDHDRAYLIDHEDARPRVLTLPDGVRWGSISVSPWTGPDSTGEAVASCYRPSSTGDEPFWGLARIDLADGRIFEEIPLDVLPTGRPCWLPQAPGKVLFTAGDGRLYLHDFAAEPGGLDESDGSTVPISGGAATRSVAWEQATSEGGFPHLADVSCFNARVKDPLLVASVIVRKGKGLRRASDLTQLWWLRLDTARMSVKEAGLLHDPNGANQGRRSVIARFPVLSAGPEGSAHVIYMAREPGQRVAQLTALAVEVDPASGIPRVANGASPEILDREAMMSQPVVGPDGRMAYCLSASTGTPMTHPLPWSGPWRDTPRISPTVALVEQAAGARSAPGRSLRTAPDAFAVMPPMDLVDRSRFRPL